MIFFPFLYEDELMYSVLARYHLYAGNENSKTTMNELFGFDTFCAATIFPTNLKRLCERLPVPDTYSAKDFIQKHTILPYYAPFIPEVRFQELKVMMIENVGTSLFMKLGKTPSSIKSPKYLRYCSQCVKEEKSIQGECYWHRVHQVEGVMVCPFHGSYLKQSSVKYSERQNKHEFISLEKSTGESKSNIRKEFQDYFEHLKFISDQTHYLLNKNISPIGLERLRNFYITRLSRKGLTSVTGRVRWRDLIPMFNQFYGEILLRELNCYISKGEEDTWIHKVLRKPKVSCHPMRHILLLGFLGETILSLEKQINIISYEPFGSGPWPCLNKASGHFQELVVNSCIITRDYKTGNPVGTFACDCGFVYSRRGPDKNTDDRYKIGRIKSFGQVWESKLAELSKQELSLRRKAEILGVDPMTVKNKLTLKEEYKNDASIKVGEKYRKAWSILIENNQGKTITEIRSLNSKTYTWLYRNDKDWLYDNYSKGIVTTQINNTRINWEKRDKEIAEQVELVAKEIINDPEKMIRVTKNEIGRRIEGLSLSSLYNNLNRMPKAEGVLNNYMESVEEFQIRRIKHIANQLRYSNPSVKEWKLIRAAGLKSKFVEKHIKLIEQEALINENYSGRLV